MGVNISYNSYYLKDTEYRLYSMKKLVQDGDKWRATAN